MAQDPTLLSELGWAQVATALENCLRQVRADEAREDFFEIGEPGYQPSAIEAFTSAARMLAQLGDERLYTAFQHQLGEDSPLQDFLQPAVEFAQTQGRVESYELGRAAEEKRMNERERVLNQEYRDIEARHGQAGVEAADQLAANLSQEGLLYHPDADQDLLRAQLRVTAEQETANRRGLRQGAFLTEFDKGHSEFLGLQCRTPWLDCARHAALR